MQGVQSQEQLDETWRVVKAAAAHWDELMSACRTSSTDLRKALDLARGGSKKKSAGKAKAKPKAAGKKVSAMYQVFDFKDAVAIAEYTSPLPQEHNVSDPFIVRAKSLPTIFVGDGATPEQMNKLEAEMSSFEEKFQKSDLRFTTGKCQAALSKEGGEILSNRAAEILPSRHVLVPSGVPPASCYGSIAQHRNIQYEVSGCASIRLSNKGWRRSPAFDVSLFALHRCPFRFADS